MIVITRVRRRRLRRGLAVGWRWFVNWWIALKRLINCVGRRAADARTRSRLRRHRINQKTLYIPRLRPTECSLHPSARGPLFGDGSKSFNKKKTKKTKKLHENKAKFERRADCRHDITWFIILIDDCLRPRRNASSFGLVSTLRARARKKREKKQRLHHNGNLHASDKIDAAAVLRRGRFHVWNRLEKS